MMFFAWECLNCKKNGVSSVFFHDKSSLECISKFVVDIINRQHFWDKNIGRIRVKIDFCHASQSFVILEKKVNLHCENTKILRTLQQ